MEKKMTSSSTTKIIGLSGPSSSGKTTLARLLQGIFNGHDNLSTFMIHEDDFYLPDDKIPYTTTASGTTIQDWDTISAIDVSFLSSALDYVRTHGVLPPRLKSIQDLNEKTDSGVDADTLSRLREGVRRRLGALQTVPTGAGADGIPTLAFLEGFLLYAPPKAEDKDHVLRSVHEKIDVRLFLTAPYDLVKTRRESRSGYVTSGPAPGPSSESTGDADGDSRKEKKQQEASLEGKDYQPPQNFWVDPPGYVDDIVWPRYVEDHSWLLLPEEEVSRGDSEDWVKRVGQGVNVRGDAGVLVAPGKGQKPMVELLEWAVEEVMKFLETIDSL